MIWWIQKIRIRVTVQCHPTLCLYEQLKFAFFVTIQCRPIPHLYDLVWYQVALNPYWKKILIERFNASPWHVCIVRSRIAWCFSGATLVGSTTSPYESILRSPRKISLHRSVTTLISKIGSLSLLNRGGGTARLRVSIAASVACVLAVLRIARHVSHRRVLPQIFEMKRLQSTCSQYRQLSDMWLEKYAAKSVLKACFILLLNPLLLTLPSTVLFRTILPILNWQPRKNYHYLLTLRRCCMRISKSIGIISAFMHKSLRSNFVFTACKWKFNWKHYRDRGFRLCNLCKTRKFQSTKRISRRMSHSYRH